MNKFIYNLFKYTSTDNKNNIISPYSFDLLLYLLIKGTEKTLQSELFKLIDLRVFDIDSGLNKNLFEDLVNSFSSGELKIEDSIEHSDLLQVKKSYLSAFSNSLKPKISSFKSGIENLQFAIINRLEIKTRWQDSFEEIKTKSDIFYSEDGDEIESYFMYQSNRHGKRKIEFIEKDIFSAIRIPLEDEQLAFEIILPKEGHNTKEVYNYLEPLELLKLNKEYREIKNIDVIIPIFNFQNIIYTREHAKKLNIETIFNPSSDFNKLFIAPDVLFIGEIKQHNSINVGLKGIELSSETIAYGGLGSISRPQTDFFLFEANRPFIFIVRERHQNIIFQLGQFHLPNSVAKNDQFLRNNWEKEKRMKLGRIRKVRPYVPNTSLREIIFFGLECLDSLVKKNDYEIGILEMWVKDVIMLLEDKLPEDFAEVEKLDFWRDKQTGFNFDNKYIGDEDFKKIEEYLPKINNTIRSICGLISSFTRSENDDYFPSIKLYSFEGVVSEMIDNELDLPDLGRFRNINETENPFGELIEIDRTKLNNLI